MTPTELEDLRRRAEALRPRAGRLQDDCRINPGYWGDLGRDFARLFLEIEEGRMDLAEAVGWLDYYEADIQESQQAYDAETERERTRLTATPMRFID